MQCMDKNNLQATGFAKHYSANKHNFNSHITKRKFTEKQDQSLSNLKNFLQE